MHSFPLLFKVPGRSVHFFLSQIHLSHRKPTFPGCWEQHVLTGKTAWFLACQRLQVWSFLLKRTPFIPKQVMLHWPYSTEIQLEKVKDKKSIVKCQLHGGGGVARLPETLYSTEFCILYATEVSVTSSILDFRLLEICRFCSLLDWWGLVSTQQQTQLHPTTPT